MGVLDFIRDAGEKLTEMGEEAKLAERIEKRIIDLGARIKRLDVDVEGEVVILKGHAASEEDREKAVRIAGNVRGIAKVSDRMVLKGEHGGTVRSAKPLQKKARPDKPEKKVKEPRPGGRKVRPADSSQKKMRSARKGRRRTP